MPNTCIVCGHVKTRKEQILSLHRFPADAAKRTQWLTVVGLSEGDIKPHTRICSRHFHNGDTSNTPSLFLGKKFASPKKLQLDRGKQAIRRQAMSPPIQPPPTKKKHLADTPRPLNSSRSATPALSESTDSETTFEPSVVMIGEPLFSDYSVHELPDSGSDISVELPLTARVEVLEAEKHQWRVGTELRHWEQVEMVSKPFRIEDIAGKDSLVRFYTGFISYKIFLAFFHFLGPSAHQLTYWRSKETQSRHKRKTKLNPQNQLFLTLVKLRLNLKTKDLAYRFDISIGLVSKYVTTWICFLYCHMKEIEWMPSPNQVAATLPVAFKKDYPTTFAIIDASELFIETPADLQMQSSTWSNYKHHNTAKFLIACTPNGSISHVSPLYVGSISDVELTRNSGFLETLQGKPGISIMADRGFTIKDQLSPSLNSPPFMEGRKYLPVIVYVFFYNTLHMYILLLSLNLFSVPVYRCNVHLYT